MKRSVSTSSQAGVAGASSKRNVSSALEEAIAGPKTAFRPISESPTEHEYVQILCEKWILIYNSLSKLSEAQAEHEYERNLNMLWKIS